MRRNDKFSWMSDEENLRRQRFNKILLEPEQISLLIKLAEAVQSVPRNKLRKFIVIRADQGDFIDCPNNKQLEAYFGDVEALGREGLIALSQDSQAFDVTPLGLTYCDYLKDTGQIEKISSELQTDRKTEQEKESQDEANKQETKSSRKVDDVEFENVFRDNLIAFLISEKKFPRESMNHGIVAEAPDLDLAVAHPDTDDSLAVFDCKSGHYGKPSSELSESMAKAYKSGLVGILNPFAYIVIPSEKSNEDFVIFEVEGDGTSHEISYGDFPTYNQLLFESPLSDPCRRTCRNLTIFAKHEHGFSVDAPCQDYINLQIKENKRTAAQIHRLNDSDKNIALVLAGYQKDFPNQSFLIICLKAN